ncbi:copper homeostasis membrane protein CopD [Erwinia sp. PK3-005]|uniref:Copper resistance protein D n=1 Tax=Mixta hanseatica TaxID=2872648 RepID=A0ABY4R414_9GAMM|nr:copper homeostasis membrane protein CopD [Mixta hanseatica]UQY42644.1 copper homeostasis membrane protein CopD [Mixta hanseatica]
MALETLYIFCRWAHFSSLMLFTGSAFYSALLAPRRYQPILSRRLMPLLSGCAILTLLSALAILAAQTGLMSGDWRNIAQAPIWWAVLQTGFGQAWCLQLLAALLACLSLAAGGRARQRLLLLCGLVQLGGMALVGHAAMLDGWPGVLQRFNQAIHLTGAAFWAGGLLPLLWLMRDARQPLLRDAAIRTMMRFSRYGHLAVALTLLSGIINTAFIVGWPWPANNDYRQWLLIKIGLVALMVCIALFNRYWLVPRFSIPGSRAQLWFVRATQLEIATAILVVVSVSVFATLQP